MAIDEKWKQTMDDALANRLWDRYDFNLQTEINDYNHRLKDTPGYKAVEWNRYPKALLWVESGGPRSTTWTRRVMQIGNPGDAGYKAIQNLSEGAAIVISQDLAKTVKTADINKPEINIRFGLAYLFTRMAKVEFKDVFDPADSKIYQVTVEAGDSLEKIAKKVGSTTRVLLELNPSKKSMLKPGDLIHYRKASYKLVIVGWRAFTTSTIAERYNGGGDSNYEEKLDYVLELLGRLKR